MSIGTQGREGASHKQGLRSHTVLAGRSGEPRQTLSCTPRVLRARRPGCCSRWHWRICLLSVVSKVALMLLQEPHH